MQTSAHLSRRAWLILAVLLLFSIAAPLNQSKVPPILPILMEAWGLPVGRAGLLMSLYAITGLLLALPAGFIFHRVGYRWAGVVAGGSIAVGVALGALRPQHQYPAPRPGHRGDRHRVRRGDGSGHDRARGFPTAAGSRWASGRPGFPSG